MKISFTTLSCPTWNWEKVIDEALRLGYDGIEIRGADGEMYLPKARPFLPENIRRTVEQLKVKNLAITDLGSSVKFHDPEKYNENIVEGKEYIDLAESLGVPFVRIFGDKIPDLAKKDETFELIAKGIKELCNYCEGKNVSILFETHGDFNHESVLMPIFEKVKSHHLSLLWDIEHTYKKYGDDITGFLNKFFPYIKHMHIKDLKRVGDEYKLCMIGEGDIPIGKIIGLMKERGYNGYLSIEWEKKWVPTLEEPEVVIPAYIDYIRKFI